jgi:uncharacterized protein (TIGR02594 family)
MVMADPPIFPLFSEANFQRLRGFARLGTGFVRTAEFALAFGAGLAALPFGGDMVILACILIFGWIMAAVGIFASNLPARDAKIACLAVLAVFVAEGVLLHWHSGMPNNIAGNNCEPISSSAPDWLLVAAKECGQKELTFPEENQRINDYYAALRNGKHYRQNAEDLLDDWASPFVEWSLEQVGKLGPRKIDPLAWLNWGKEANPPQAGSIVIMRNNGIPHVGFYLRDDGDRVDVLGGNQDDQVKISDYPKSAVLGYRVPPDVEVNSATETPQTEGASALPSVQRDQQGNEIIASARIGFVHDLSSYTAIYQDNMKIISIQPEYDPVFGSTTTSILGVTYRVECSIIKPSGQFHLNVHYPNAYMFGLYEDKPSLSEKITEINNDIVSFTINPTMDFFESLNDQSIYPPGANANELQIDLEKD